MATFNITNQISNTTVDPSNLRGLTAGQPLTITLTANSGYYFGSVPRLQFSDGMGGNLDFTFNTEQSSNPTVYTRTFTAQETKDMGDYGTGYIRGGNITKATTFTVRNNIANTSTTPTDLTFMTGTEVTITITANDGYYFTTAPYIESSDGMGSLNTYRFSTSETSFP